MKNEIYESHKASLLGADANLIAMLSYLAATIVGWIPVIKYVSFFAPLIVYFIERDSLFVKFHSMQAFMLNVISSLLTIIYSIIMGASVAGMGISLGTASISTGFTSIGVAFVSSFAVMAISIALLIFNLLAMIGAYRYKEYHIPIIGTWSANIAGTN